VLQLHCSFFVTALYTFIQKKDERGERVVDMGCEKLVEKMARVRLQTV